MTEPVGLLPVPAPTAPRLTVRHRLADGSATDVVGVLIADDGAALTVLPDDRGAEQIRHDAVIATRRVPPRRVRPTSSPADLERLAARGWPGTENARLGGWLLRSGGGWTSRANSALAVGDPGMPLDVAFDAVSQFYRAAGLPPRLHLPLPDERVASTDRPDTLRVVDAAAEAAGWIAYDHTCVLTADLRRLEFDPTESEAGSASISWGGSWGGDTVARWSARPEDAWLSILRDGSALTEPAAARVLRSAPASYLTVRAEGDVAGIGRVVVTDDWCGIAAIEVAPNFRRQGHGRRIALALLNRGRAMGARFAYLQTLQSNSAALALYATLGFTFHHAYHYRRLGAESQSRHTV